MPKAYEGMRDKFAEEGMSYDSAQGKAAAIYNSANPEAPVTGKSESRPKGGKRGGKKGLQALVAKSRK